MGWLIWLIIIVGFGLAIWILLTLRNIDNRIDNMERLSVRRIEGHLRDIADSLKGAKQ